MMKQFPTLALWCLLAFLTYLVSCHDSSSDPDTLIAGSQTTWLNDGVLTDEDLEPGESGIILMYTPPEEGATPFELHYVSTHSEIVYDHYALMCPQGWALWIRVSHDSIEEDFSVFVWFQDSDLEVLEMTEGSGDVFAMAVDIPSIEHGGDSYGPFGGSVTITQTSGTTTSGWADQEALIEVAYYAPDQDPSGEKFQILGVAFNQITTYPPNVQEECEPRINPGDIECTEGWIEGEPGAPDLPCNAILDGVCFQSIDCACATCGGLELCNSSLGIPAMVTCE